MKLPKLFIGLVCHLILFVWLPSCTHRSHLIVKKLAIPYSSKKPILNNVSPLTSPPAITVWIHGTRFIRRPAFNAQLAYQAVLKHSSDLKTTSYSYSIAHLLNSVAPDIFPIEEFYSFIWSGGISNQERIIAAQILYHQLQKIITQYRQKWDAYPVIRIISHSHGGNVVLNMVNIQKQHPSMLPLTIESFIMLACPVQNNTMHLTQNSIFGSIYSLYSSLDMVQVIAPQRFYGMLPFSYRKFPPHGNIIQAKVRMNGHAIFHTEFTTKRFFKSLPLIFTTLQTVAQSVQDEWKKQHILLRLNTRCQNRRPYHTKKREHSSPLSQ